MASPSIEVEDGEFWVDSGHADIGPFATKEEAEAHIDRMKKDRE